VTGVAQFEDLRWIIGGSNLMYYEFERNEIENVVDMGDVTHSTTFSDSSREPCDV